MFIMFELTEKNQGLSNDLPFKLLMKAKEKIKKIRLFSFINETKILLMITKSIVDRHLFNVFKKD